MKSVRTALLLGATGLVGGHCLDLLLKDKAYAKVVSIGRRETAREDPRLEQHTVDFERLEDYSELMRAVAQAMIEVEKQRPAGVNIFESERIVEIAGKY